MAILNTADAVVAIAQMVRDGDNRQALEAMTSDDPRRVAILTAGVLVRLMNTDPSEGKAPIGAQALNFLTLLTKL